MFNVEVVIFNVRVNRTCQTQLAVEGFQSFSRENVCVFTGDTVAQAWDYDFLRKSVLALVEGRRFNLQETVVHAVYDMVAARAGVTALRVSTRKPDVYPDCRAVGVELSSF